MTRKCLTIVAVLVMVCYVFTGLRLFCAINYVNARELWNGDLISPLLIADTPEPFEAYGSLGKKAEKAGGASECSCKKRKSCPAIPRVTLTSNLSSRTGVLEHKAQSTGSGSLVNQTDIGFLGVATARSGVGLLSWAFISPSSDLTVTCVLLI